MSEHLPLVIIVLLVVLVLALIALLVWTKKRGQRVIGNRKIFFPLWVTGLIVALLAAFFMFDGDILGDNTSGIATIIGIVGIGLIAMSNVTLIAFRRK